MKTSQTNWPNLQMVTLDRVVQNLFMKEKSWDTGQISLALVKDTPPMCQQCVKAIDIDFVTNT